MRYVIADKQVNCPHCGGDDFTEGIAQLTTATRTVLGFETADSDARILTCSQCGRIEWFVSAEYDPEDDMSEQIECPSCGGIVPAGTDTCPTCGWPYKA